MKKGDQTKEHILRETRQILVANGFHHTSITDIIHATGVKKGNLYYHFSSKEELCIAVLEDAKRDFFTILDDSLVGTTPHERIVRSVEIIFSKIKKADLTGGCLFGNAALEMSDSNDRFAGVIRDVFTGWIDRLHEQVVLGKKDQSILAKGEPQLLAKMIVATVEGAIMMARVSKSEEDLDDCLHILDKILGNE